MDLKSNLANIKTEVDLFGVEHKKLSMRDRIGFLPISIWRPDWTVVKQLKSLIGDDGSTRELLNDKLDFAGSKVGVSIFNPHLAQMILSAYCPTEAKIYDPFGGGGTRGFVAAAMGHKYVGVELRQNEVDRIKEQQKKLETEFSILCGDCRTVAVESDFTFSYTCPPYYNLEVYSTLENDLSASRDYDTFLMGMQEALQVTYNALRPGSLAVWVVGNFRDKQGNLTHFNGDTARLGKSVGFKLHDELIFWGAAGVASMRSGMFEANRRSVRVHESILIFKKD